MKKKMFVEKKYNVGIVESYKPADNENSPILGTFKVNGMTVENMVSQNRTKYSPEVWAQPTSFGKGGKFITEDGKLKPSTLFGSLDHPSDGHVELLLSEAAIAWHDVQRDASGRWDGVADILKNPQGRIVKTFLDYAAVRGGGDLFGVSSRALGESVMTESNGEQVESIVPESFELMSFDFVYNPSFQTAVAHLTESKKHMKKSLLVESVRNLAKEDEEHAKVYENFADKLEEVEKDLLKNERVEEETMKNKFAELTEGKTIDKAKANYLKELKDKENTLHNALYDLDNMTDEEFSKGNEGSRTKMIKVLKKEYEEVQTELRNLEAPVVENKKGKEIKKVIKEADEIEEEELEEEEVIEDEEEVIEDEEVEEEEHHATEEELLSSIAEKLDRLVDVMTQAFAPVEDAQLDFEDEDLEEEDSEEDESEEEEDSDMLDMDEEDLEDLTDEELEYLASIED